MFTATLYARRRYAERRWSPRSPLVTLAAVLALPAAWGAGVLVAGVLAGAALEAAVSVVLVLRGRFGGAPRSRGPALRELRCCAGSRCSSAGS